MEKYLRKKSIETDDLDQELLATSENLKQNDLLAQVNSVVFGNSQFRPNQVQ
jgi:hypothetical protein